MDEQHSDAPQNAETGEQTSDAGSSGPSADFVTSDQLAAFQKDLMDGVRKTVAGIVKSQATTKPAAPQARATPEAPTQDFQGLLKRERSIERAMARSGLSEEQGDIVRSLIDASDPDDVTAFVQGFAKTMGIATAAAPTPTPTAEAKTAPNPNPASDGGTPGMTPSIESDDVPVWKWSQEKVDKFIKEKGYREFAAEMKKRLPKDLKGVRFALPR